MLSHSSRQEEESKQAPAPQAKPNKDQVAVLQAVSKVDNMPLSIFKPAEQTKYENLSAEETKIGEYLRTKYKAEIAKCKFWTQDIIPRFVTDTYYIKKYDDRLKLTSSRFQQYLCHVRKYQFDDIIAVTGKDKDTLDENISMFNLYFYGIDHMGHPIVWDNGSEFGLGKRIKKTFCNDKGYERFRYYRCRFKRLESNLYLKLGQHYGCKISQSVCVLDLKKASVSDFHTNRAFHKWNIREASELFPETAYKVFIINAPWAFRAVWKICRTFLDDITVEKTTILGKDYLKELVKYIDINMIPKEYGGQGVWTPNPGNVPKDFPFQVDEQ